MLILLSPAKNMNEDRAAGQARSTPRFLAEAETLVSVARDWSQDEISQLMQVSPAIAELNVTRFAEWTPASGRALAAGQIFDGDVYKHLEMQTMDDATLSEAARRLRILSGLYGLLRPTDAVRAYRLEMGRKIPGHAAGTLYRFWGDKIARAIVDEAHALETGVILNLASEEYAKAVDRNALTDLTMIDARFEEERGGERRVIGVTAKRARGAMARWVLENGITDPKDLEGFDKDGFAFDVDASTPTRPVFLRA